MAGTSEHFNLGPGFVLIAVVVALGGFAWVAFGDQIYPFNDSLEPDGQFEYTVDDDISRHTIEFGEPGRKVAADIVVVTLEEDQYEVRLAISHEDATRLQSLRLEFDFPQTGLPFAKRLPGGQPWPEMTFQPAANNSGAVLEMPDMYPRDTGTVVIQFILEETELYDHPIDNFWLSIDMSVTEDGLWQLLKYNASANVNVAMPGS